MSNMNQAQYSAFMTTIKHLIDTKILELSLRQSCTSDDSDENNLDLKLYFHAHMTNSYLLLQPNILLYVCSRESFLEKNEK